MLPQRYKTGKPDDEALNLISISLSESLPSSLGNSLPAHSCVSPKFPPPKGRRAFFGRRRSTSLSRWRSFIPRHLPLWARWSILATMVLVMLLQSLLRGQAVPDGREMYLASKSKLNWAFAKLKPQKVAIYCGRNADFDIVNSLITGISLDGIRQRVKPSIYAEQTKDFIHLTSGQSAWIRRFATSYSQPLSLLRTGQQKPDILFIPPSETPLNAIINLLNRNKKSRAIFVIKDPKKFILSFLDDPSLSVFKSLLQARRISFLMTETRQVNFFTRKLISLFQGERDISSRISERVRSYTPLMDIPARQTFPGPNRQTMLHYGVFYDDDNSEVSIKHINSLIYGFGEWISKDNNATGYDIVQNVTSGLDVIKKQSKGQGVVTLHIFFPPHLNTERKLAIKESIHIPESIKPAIFVHQASKSHSLYETVSRMHLLLPSHPYQFPANNNEDPDPYEPIVPIGLSTRIRILLPHSLTGSYFDRIDIPALISYPDDPEAIKEGQKAITIMEAVSMLKQHKHPRLTMGIQRGPWIRLDNQIYWKELLKNRKIDNINAFAEILSM